MGDDERIDGLIQAAVKENSQKMARALVGFVVAVATGGGVFLGAGGLQHTARPDPFTGTDGVILRHEVIAECKAYTDLSFQRHSQNIPPFCTRIRLDNIDTFLLKTYPNYAVPCEGY